MYSEHKIERLSKAQISRLLNGHGVRVRHGGHHHIALSHEQSKKHHKSVMHGKGYTLHFDPYQIANHQHLREKVRHAVRQMGGKVGTNLGKHLTGNVGQLADAGTGYLVRQMGGKVGTNLGKHLAGNVGQLSDAGTGYLVRQMGGKVGTNLGKHLTGNVGQLADAGTGYLVRQMGGKVGRPRKMYGGDGRGMGEARRQEAERSSLMEHGSPIAEVEKVHGPNYTGGKVSGRLHKMYGGAGRGYGQERAQEEARYSDPGTPGIRRGGKLSNKLKHAQQVMDFMGHNYQGIAHAVAPVAKPIFGALTNKAVNAINPVQQLNSLGDSIKHLFGGEVRKRGRPRKHKGGALHQNGSTGPYGGSIDYLNGILY